MLKERLGIAARAAFGDVPGYVSTLDVPAAREGDRALVAFSSSAEETAPAILRLVSAGYHVVTTAEEMAWPPRHIWEAMHTAAKSHRRTIIMTGANPGFVMDRLPLVAVSASRGVKHITVRRRVDSATRRDTLVAKTGRGLSREPRSRRRRRRAGSPARSRAPGSCYDVRASDSSLPGWVGCV